MDKNTIIANLTTVGGIAMALAIAQLPLVANAVIMSITGVGCGYLTYKQHK